jgi:DedD protein
MAFFKTRKGSDESLASSSRPESVEAMRRRAKHRLIGAAVLVLMGVIGFPVLFDTQPRPIAVDIPIEIPDRNKVKPLSAPVTAAANGPSAGGSVTAPPAAPKPEEKTAVAPATTAPAAIKTEAKPQAEPEPRPASKPEQKPVARAEPEPKDSAFAADGAKAKALLEGKPAETAAAPAVAEGRFVVQVGAFADPGKARETRLKVEKAGMKTYTHVAETKDGTRIRVRVGPFPTRADADKAADRIKALDLPVAVLTL